MKNSTDNTPENAQSDTAAFYLGAVKRRAEAIGVITTVATNVISPLLGLLIKNLGQIGKPSLFAVSNIMETAKAFTRGQGPQDPASESFLEEKILFILAQKSDEELISEVGELGMLSNWDSTGRHALNFVGIDALQPNLEAYIMDRFADDERLQDYVKEINAKARKNIVTHFFQELRKLAVLPEELDYHASAEGLSKEAIADTSIGYYMGMSDRVSAIAYIYMDLFAAVNTELPICRNSVTITSLSPFYGREVSLRIGFRDIKLVQGYKGMVRTLYACDGKDRYDSFWIFDAELLHNAKLMLIQNTEEYIKVHVKDNEFDYRKVKKRIINEISVEVSEDIEPGDSIKLICDQTKVRAEVLEKGVIPVVSECTTDSDVDVSVNTTSASAIHDDQESHSYEGTPEISEEVENSDEEREQESAMKAQVEQSPQSDSLATEAIAAVQEAGKWLTRVTEDAKKDAEGKCIVM